MSFKVTMQTVRKLDSADVPAYFHMLREQQIPLDVIEKLMRQGYAEWVVREKDQEVVTRWRMEKMDATRQL